MSSVKYALKGVSVGMILTAVLIAPARIARADCNWGNGASTPQSVFNQSCIQQGGVPHGCSCDSPSSSASSGGASGGMNSQQQIMMQGAQTLGTFAGQQLGKALFGSPEDDARNAQQAAVAQQRQAAEAARQAELRRQAELQRQAEEDAKKQRILGMLKDAESTPNQLTLKTDDDSELKVTTVQSNFGTKAIVPVSAGAPSVGGLQIKTGDDTDVAPPQGIRYATAPDTQPKPNMVGGTNRSPVNTTAPSVGGLQLKTLDDSDAIPLPAGTKFADLPDTQSRANDPEHLAMGHHIVDCIHANAVYKRMDADLLKERALIDKYQEQIKEARSGRREIREKGEVLALKTAFDEAREIAKSFDVVKARLGAMKLNGMSQTDRAGWMRSMKALDETYEKLEALPDAYDASKEYVDSVSVINQKQALLTRIKDHAAAMQKLLLDSGFAEQSGENLAEYGFGPGGALAFRMAKLGIEVTEIGVEHHLNEQEIDQAQATYDTLSDQYRRAAGMVYDAKLDIVECHTDISEKN